MCFQRWTRGISHWWVGIDWRKVFHSIKGGLVLGLVSCVLLSKDVYNALGKNVIWAILTVVVVFECTVGRFLLLYLGKHKTLPSSEHCQMFTRISFYRTNVLECFWKPRDILVVSQLVISLGSQRL